MILFAEEKETVALNSLTISSVPTMVVQHFVVQCHLVMFHTMIDYKLNCCPLSEEDLCWSQRRESIEQGFEEEKEIGEGKEG